VSIDLVRSVYAAFGRADLPAVLAALAEDVDWRYCGPAAAPYSGRFRGREGAKRFFETYLAAFALTSFEPQRFLADGETVVVLGRESGSVAATGRSAAYDWVHVFVVRDGKVAEFREYPDATAVDALFRTA
jgi:uncharacterized protein